ncbi:hypothetical protein BXZ70DRAFT_1008810 [Cristinia sonorae]|uniref:Uncharacterized protein n=1 Tax=Cristinia sonorae TaxID=1940300 RepID=A0A8K0UNC6_9AGAR|nr:hypothetical protein BXZ70DRAFT_1008810 [Cristinia sonorae]
MISRKLAFVPITFAVIFRAWLEYFSTDRMYAELRRLDAFPSKDVAWNDPSTADTTAVVLNWSRFPNVLLISTLLCGPWLDGVIKEVIIWNNSPVEIHHSDFRNTGCSRRKLKIHNSAENVYFQARFLACAKAATPYCFIQDDDYLVRSEIIHTLHANLSQSTCPNTIHLLPPHEHLSSTLRELHIPPTGLNDSGPIHTSFAWLGHGTMLHRSEAVDFLALMHQLNATEDEMKMADNYYTILSNRVPEVWFDQGIELGGGQPFTVGLEGDTRNAMHILRATEFLQSLLRRTNTGNSTAPYVSLNTSEVSALQAVSRAPCKGVPCLLETNIALLPEDIVHTSDEASDILKVEAHNLNTLGLNGVAHYTNHPPSSAVDRDVISFFESLQNATSGDYILLQFAYEVLGKAGLDIVWIVDKATEDILQNTQFTTSLDNKTWRPVAHKTPQCRDASDFAHSKSDTLGQQLQLRECIVQIYPPFIVGGDKKYDTSADGFDEIRFVRAEFHGGDRGQGQRWKVHEVFLDVGGSSRG